MLALAVRLLPLAVATARDPWDSSLGVHGKEKVVAEIVQEGPARPDAVRVCALAFRVAFQSVGGLRAHQTRQERPALADPLDGELAEVAAERDSTQERAGEHRPVELLEIEW